MGRLALIWILIVAGSSLFAADTTFIYTYGGPGYDQGRSIYHTLDGGFIMTGATGSFGAGNSDIYLIKVDSVGIFQWSKTFGGFDTEWGMSVQQTNDTGYVVAGYTNSFGAGGYDMYIVKTDMLGDTLWTRTYGGADWDVAYSITQTADGGYAVAGETHSYGAGNNDAYLIKLDSNGDSLWTKTFGGSGVDFMRSIKETFDGGLIMAGGTSSFGFGKLDAYIIKTNVTGDTTWTFVRSGVEDGWGNSIIQLMDSSYAMIGADSNCCLGKFDIYFLKVDKNGNLLNENFLGTDQEDEGFDILQYNPDTLVFVGSTRGAGILGTLDIFMGFTDTDGNWKFGRTFGQDKDETAYAICMTNFEGYALFGTTNSFGANYTDFYLLTTDSIGFDQYGVQFTDITSYPDSIFVDTSHTLVLPFTEELSSSYGYISVYPIPAQEEVRIELHAENTNLTLDRFEMYDVRGTLVKSILGSGSSNLVIDRGGIADGIYLFRIKIRSNSSDSYEKYVSGKVVYTSSQ